MSIDISIIIVNWNVRERLRRLLASLFDYTHGITLEIIVVDNNSHDGSQEMLKSEFPQVILLDNDTNRGFAAGCNQGIKIAQGEFILLLNPDTEFFDDALTKLVAWMQAHPDVGIGSGKLLNPDQSLQRTIRRFPDACSQAFVILKLHHLFPRASSLTRYFANNFDYGREQEVDQVIGAFFCIRRPVVEKIGLLDEAFFLWFEEVDFCKRAKEAGFRIVYTPLISLIHHGGESFAQVFALKKQRYYNDSLKIYAKKHWGLPTFVLFLVLAPISLALAWLVQKLQIKPRAYKRLA